MTISFPRTFVLSLMTAVLAAGWAAADPPERTFCNVPGLGTGTGLWPPVGCSYISPEEVFLIIDGLPPGTTIEAAPLFYGIVCTGGSCEVPGGDLGGTTSTFNSTLQLHMTGTGDLAGFSRMIEVPVSSEVHTAPRTPGQSVQTFATDYDYLSGSVAGDPDFSSLVLSAGSFFLLPSPGSTTMRDRPGGAYSVDSFFDVTYQIDFEGAPGGQLEGLSGSTQGTLRIQIERPPLPVGACVVAGDGTGTAELPPADCTYLNSEDEMLIIDGLPPGTTMELQFRETDFVCDFSPCGRAGGALGGEEENFEAPIQLQVRGTGELAGYTRTLTLAADQVNLSAPRTPGDPIQHFQTRISSLIANLTGDPDFSSLTIRAGYGEGHPSPGMTTIADIGAGDFVVDSFFDVDYRIEFTGAPGSALEGFSGTTIGTMGLIAGIPDIFADGFELDGTNLWTRVVQ